MVTVSDIITLVRYLINDNLETQTDIFTYANSDVFTLTEANVSAITSVSKNDVALGSGDYSFDSSTNKLTLTSGVGLAGDTIEIIYTMYSNYSDTEITNYIYSALIYLSINKYYNFVVESSTFYPEPEDSEKNLIAMVTAIKMNPSNQTIRLPDISIQVQKDLPTDEKIRKAIADFKFDTGGKFFVA